MENYYLPNNTSISSTHPYAYLTFLNNLYSYYQQDQQKKPIKRTSKKMLQTKSFKKIDVPNALYKNYVQQQNNHNRTSKKKTYCFEKKDTILGSWKDHLQSLKKYRRTVSSRRLKINHNHEMSFDEENRICSQDPKNIFLKKLIKSGKIPSYNRTQLQSQVLDNLRTLNVQNKYITATSRNIRTSQSNSRPKSKNILRHPLTAKPENKQSKKSPRATQYDDEFQNIFEKKIHLQQNWDSMNLQKQANDLRHFDRTIPYKNINKVNNFIDKIHLLQKNIKDY